MGGFLVGGRQNNPQVFEGIGEFNVFPHVVDAICTLQSASAAKFYDFCLTDINVHIVVFTVNTEPAKVPTGCQTGMMK